MLVVAAVVGLLIAIEIGLRVLVGLGDRPIYIPDEEIGYLLAPNQKMRRFGNRIFINRYSMRSDEFADVRPAATLRILLLGDSIANGAWWTDQAQTISAAIAQQLQTNLPQPFQMVEVLNASANSWGPRNQLAYLKRFGTFDSQIVVLLLNTDDLFATAPTSLLVGRDPNYPDRKPYSAIGELLERVFARPKPIPGIVKVYQEKGDRVSHNLVAIENIDAIARQNRAQFLLAIAPLLREVDGTAPREYEQKARSRLKAFVQTRKITFVDFLPLFKHSHRPTSLYRDRIHLSPDGNRLVSDTLTSVIRNQLSVVSDRAPETKSDNLLDN
ncbi:SGNH/GDSL hydrolase family protein [Hydrococcus rivularis]|uniref:SGNH/GDSL hydrolase family protein n=1 Tax=Hydrococcus rivularis TaxID=1616834 RepID=UPI003CCC0B91